MGQQGNSRKKVTDLAADRLRSRILSGAHPKGTLLPPERDLCLELGVSRLTLRSAITRLTAEGLVRSVQGSGTRVLDFRETGGVELLSHLVRLGFQADGDPLMLLRDLLELRRMLAIEVLGLVAERVTAEELAALRRHVTEQAGLVGVPTRFVAADLTFARLVVRAGKNLALELLFNTVARIVADNPAFEVAFMANARETVTVYGKLLDMIEARDPQRVRRVAARLLDRLDRTTLARVEEALGSPRRMTGGVSLEEDG